MPPSPSFLQVIDETAAEIPSIIDELLTSGLASPGRIAVAGRSLGGNVAYASALADSRISAIVSVVGCPQWTLLQAAQPASPRRPFLPCRHLVAGGQSTTSTRPPRRSGSSTLTSRRTTAAAPERAEYIEYAKAGHFLTPELNGDSRQQASVTWCQSEVAASERRLRSLKAGRDQRLDVVRFVDVKARDGAGVALPGRRCRPRGRRPGSWAQGIGLSRLIVAARPQRPEVSVARRSLWSRRLWTSRPAATHDPAAEHEIAFRPHAESLPDGAEDLGRPRSHPCLPRVTAMLWATNLASS